MLCSNILIDNDLNATIEAIVGFDTKQVSPPKMALKEEEKHTMIASGGTKMKEGKLENELEPAFVPNISLSIPTMALNIL